jgi:hypothetical protein
MVTFGPHTTKTNGFWRGTKQLHPRSPKCKSHSAKPWRVLESHPGILSDTLLLASCWLFEFDPIQSRNTESCVHLRVPRLAHTWGRKALGTWQGQAEPGWAQKGYTSATFHPVLREHFIIPFNSVPWQRRTLPKTPKLEQRYAVFRAPLSSPSTAKSWTLRVWGQWLESGTQTRTKRNKQCLHPKDHRLICGMLGVTGALLGRNIFQIQCWTKTASSVLHSAQDQGLKFVEHLDILSKQVRERDTSAHQSAIMQVDQRSAMLQ